MYSASLKHGRVDFGYAGEAELHVAPSASPAYPKSTRPCFKEALYITKTS